MEELLSKSIIIDALSYLHWNPDVRGADHSTPELPDAQRVGDHNGESDHRSQDG